MKTNFLQLTFLVFCFSSQSLFAINVPAGNVYGHWTIANSPYLVQGNIAVPQDSLLQIDSGVVVQFQGHYQFLVNGRILCIGSSGNPIMFGANIDWWGIRFDGISASQDSSLFVYCNIQNGNASGTNNYGYGGAFFISDFSKIRVEHCTITNNAAGYGGALYLDHANPKIYSNMIMNNTASSYYGGGIYCSYSSPSIINNNITNNASQIYCDNSSPDIIGNSITNSSGEGIGCLNTSNPSIINNIISYNTLGITIGRSSPNIIGNLITYNNGNSAGPGIDCWDNSNPNIINNTIAYNIANLYGGGIYVSNSSPIIKNTILWGNFAPNNQGTQVALSHVSSPTFYNCDIQDSSTAFYYYDGSYTFTGTYINNINSNPLFNDTSSNNFSLQAISPCINAGDTTGVTLPLTDLTGNPRICNNVVDIGAYEFCATGIKDFSLNKFQVIIYPNPLTSSSTLQLTTQVTNAEVVIYDVLGKEMMRRKIAGNRMEIEKGNLESGVYFVRVMSEARQWVEKFVVE